MLLSKNLTFFSVLMLLVVLGQFATELYLPSMPSMATYLHVNINMIQLSIAVYVFGFAIGSMVYGTLSDKFGRRPIILTCLLVGFIGGLVCCFSFSIDSLLIGRLIQGLGFSGGSVVARSITKDISETREELAKVSSTMGILYASAIAFAPIIGGYIEKYMFWRMSFILLLVLAITTIALCWYKIPETNRNKRSLTMHVVLHDYIDVLTNRQFLLYNIISASVLCGLVAYQTMSSYLLQVRVGMLPDSFGYTALFITAALISGGLINRFMMPRRGSEKMIIIGCYLYISTSIIYIITGIFGLINIYIILAPIVIAVVASGIIYPNCSAGAMGVFDTKAGTAASIYNCLQMLGASIGSILVSLFHNANQLVLGVLFICIGGMSLFLARKLQVKVIREVTEV